MRQLTQSWMLKSPKIRPWQAGDPEEAPWKSSRASLKAEAGRAYSERSILSESKHRKRPMFEFKDSQEGEITPFFFPF